MGKRAGPKRSTGSHRINALSIGAGLVVVAVCLALMMAHGSASREVVVHARDLHWANSTLGAASVARAGNAQAVVFAVDHHLGVASDKAFDTALAEGHRTLEALRAAGQSASGNQIDRDIEVGIGEFTDIAGEILTLIESGDVKSAVEISQGAFEDSYTSLERILSEEQTRLLAAIDSTQGDVGRTATIARIFVTLLIPAAALIIYYLMARRQIRERKIEMEVELQAARELSEAKDEFIAGLSHELRTPLTSIYGFSEVLLETGIVDRAHAMELVGLINDQSADLSRMVEDLLTAARLEAGALSIDVVDVDLALELESVVQPFRRAGVEMRVTCPPIVVAADRLRLRQVIRNLVSNAVRHGGPDIMIEARARDDIAILTVIDNGAGVPATIEERLFERFVHDGRQALLAGSVGLGLAIARALVEAMDGSIRYLRVAEHSVFSITLPAASTHSPSRLGDIDLHPRQETAPTPSRSTK